MQIIITSNASFEWDAAKDTENIAKHGVSFEEAQKAFLDPNLRIVEDLAHSDIEQRWFCIGKLKRGIITVRFTYRGNRVRIYGAGFWRKGKKAYEQK